MSLSSAAPYNEGCSGKSVIGWHHYGRLCVSLIHCVRKVGGIKVK
jgi:hypothetical protein